MSEVCLSLMALIALREIFMHFYVICVIGCRLLLYCTQLFFVIRRRSACATNRHRHGSCKQNPILIETSEQSETSVNILIILQPLCHLFPSHMMQPFDGFFDTLFERIWWVTKGIERVFHRGPVIGNHILKTGGGERKGFAAPVQ